MKKPYLPKPVADLGRASRLHFLIVAAFMTSPYVLSICIEVLWMGFPENANVIQLHNGPVIHIVEGTSSVWVALATFIGGYVVASAIDVRPWWVPIVFVALNIPLWGFAWFLAFSNAFATFA